MVRELLVRGMLAGLVAGLLVFGFGRVFGEPQVDQAISFESAMDAVKRKAEEARGIHVEPEPELVSRTVQAGAGLFTGVVVYAAAFGGLFALVFAAANGRAVPLGPRATAALLAAAGFVAVYLVPNLKYPANPPSIGAPDTIGLRTALYFTMLGASVLAMGLAAAARGRLAPRFGGWGATMLALAGYVAAMAVVAWLLPAVDEVPDGFPAAVLWRFRVASLGMQAVMWATLGLLFGLLAERVLAAQGAGAMPGRHARA